MLPWQPNFAKIGKNLTKMSIITVVCNRPMQCLVLTFEIGFQLLVNSSVTLPYTRDKGVPSLFAPGPIRSLALSFPGHFAPWNFRSVALSLRTVKITIYCEKKSYKEIKVAQIIFFHFRRGSVQAKNSILF